MIVELKVTGDSSGRTTEVWIDLDKRTWDQRHLKGGPKSMASGHGLVLFRAVDNNNMSFVDADLGHTIGWLNGVRWVKDGSVAEGPGYIRHAPPTFRGENVKWVIASVEE